MGSRRVTIILLNWNGWQDTAACIRSCQQLTYPDFELLVVDNNSADGSEERLRALFPGINLIQSGANLGFAGGNNVGIWHALAQGADYICLLNNDTVVAPDALTNLVAALEGHPHAGMAGSKIYYFAPPGRLWFAGGEWQRRPWHPRHRGIDEEDAGQYDRRESVEFLTGCSMLVRAAAIRDTGLLPELFFLYLEDLDWCASFSRRGWEILYEPGSKVWHKVSSSLQGESLTQLYYGVRNRLIFLRRHRPLLLLPLLAYSCYMAMQLSLAGKRMESSNYRRGVRDFVRGRSGMMMTEEQ